MVPLMALVVALAAGVLYVATLVGPHLDAAARARTAADAAALAGAVDGPAAAGRFARDNGAELVSFTRDGDRVRVEVRIGEARATAEAAASVTWVAPGGG
ncbi:MAG: hypothetical protein D6683_09815 [Actinomyces sp.]|nr:MAG: hypothetical protein D6683_09815 [Actinomyces sp.]